MARLSFAVIVLAALVGLAAAHFDMATFEKRLGTLNYAKAAVKRVQAAQKSMDALSPADQKVLGECLQSAALNAQDMDGSLQEFLSEIAGCLNVDRSVSPKVQAVARSMSA